MGCFFVFSIYETVFPYLQLGVDNFDKAEHALCHLRRGTVGVQERRVLVLDLSDQVENVEMRLVDFVLVVRNLIFDLLHAELGVLHIHELVVVGVVLPRIRAHAQDVLHEHVHMLILINKLLFQLVELRHMFLATMDEHKGTVHERIEVGNNSA